MKIVFDGKYSRHPRDLIRRCGYGEMKKRLSAELSYIKRLGRGEFPRFHAYIDILEDSSFSVNLHLDQKEHTYSGSRAHSGEYDGPVLEQEAQRIRLTIEDDRIQE